MRWKFKRNIIVICLFVFMFTFWGSLTYTKNSKVYADPITGAAILSAGGGELLIAAAPWVLAGLAIAGAGYLAYTGTKKISRTYLDWKRKEAQKSLTNEQINAVNDMAVQWQNDPNYALDPNVIKPYLQTMGNSFTKSIDGLSYNQIDPINSTYNNFNYDYLCNTSISNLRNYMKGFPFIAYDYLITRELGFATKNTGTDLCFSYKNIYQSPFTIPVIKTHVKANIINTVNGTSKHMEYDSLLFAPNTYDSTSFFALNSTSGIFYPGTSWNVASYYSSDLATVFQGSVNVLNVLSVAGDGSICYYPPIANTKTQSVDVPSSIPLGAYDTAKSTDVISVPSSVGDSTISVPVDTPASIPDTGGTTGDTTGFWTSLWEWLKKILDAITGLPGLIVGGIVSVLEALKTLVGNIVGVIQSILDHILAIPDAISTKIDDWIKQKMNDPPGPPNIADLFKVLLLILIALINLLLAAITFVFALRGIPSNPDFFPTNVRLGIDWVKALNIPYFNLSFYNLVLTVVFVLSLFKVIKTIRTSIYKNFG